MRTILIDSREPVQIQDQIKAVYPEAMVAALGDHCGDLLATLDTGTLVIERKETSDFVASIADGRLFEQANHIPELATFAFVVVDGEFKYSDDGYLMGVRGRLGYIKTGWTRKVVQSALVSIQDPRQYGIGIYLTHGESYAEAIETIIRQCEKEPTAHTTRVKHRAVNPFDDGTQAKIDFLAGFPSVGTERAANLVQAYPDKTIAELLEVVTQNVNRTQKRGEVKITQWGPATYEKIKQYLGLRPSQYIKVEARTEWEECV